MEKRIITYPNIDMEKTGLKLQKYMKEAGYSVKEIQNYLHLSCPQPIYRWIKGKILPSVDHLYMLSRLFGVHMEELLEEKTVIHMPCVEIPISKDTKKRLLMYYCRIHSKAA